MPPVTITSSSSTSSDLLSRVRHHDHDAWQRFVSLYSPLVYRWCRSAGAGAIDAGDVMQEVFAKVFSTIATFRHDRPGDTLRGWLRVICRNKLNDLFRRRSGEAAPVGGTDGALRISQVPAWDDDESSLAVDRHALVRQAAELVRGEFEFRTWQAFWSMAVEGRTAADTAQSLGMTAGAVRQAKYAVSRRLREELSGEFS